MIPLVIIWDQMTIFMAISSCEGTFFIEIMIRTAEVIQFLNVFSLEFQN